MARHGARRKFTPLIRPCAFFARGGLSVPAAKSNVSSGNAVGPRNGGGQCYAVLLQESDPV